MKLRSLPLIVLFGCCPLFASFAGCSMFDDHPRRAEAELRPAPGVTTRGVVTFVDNPDGVQVTYNLRGLPPDSDHGLHIHERGDCIAAGPSGLGPIFNPLPAPVGAGRNLSHAEGDLPDIHADSNGVAAGFFVISDLSLDGVRSVVGRVLVVHRDPDDPYTMVPNLSDGPRLACGVIVR